MKQRGFTLVELLVVVVIIGVLAAIAIPKFTNTKGKAYLAQLKTDLRNLATVEEAFYYDSTYYVDDDRLIALNRYRESTGVTVTTLQATPGGWSARAVHASLPGMTCYLFYGNVTPVGPSGGSSEGKIACG